MIEHSVPTPWITFYRPIYTCINRYRWSACLCHSLPIHVQRRHGRQEECLGGT